MQREGELEKPEVGVKPHVEGCMWILVSYVPEAGMPWGIFRDDGSLAQASSFRDDLTALSSEAGLS